MTAPRQILPGVTYLVTRRCSERRLFLRPSPVTNDIFLFVLAVASQRYGVKVHAFCVLSNHYHLLVTDPDARLPAFMQYLNSLVARATNASLGRWEALWSSKASYSAVAHGATEDMVRKAAYTLANPVAAGLVRSGHEWPGLWSAPEQLGVATLEVNRPKSALFRAEGDLPESAELTLALPPGFDSADEFQSQVTAELHALEEKARADVAASGREFLGRARVLAQKPFARPARGEPRRKLNPRFAAIDKWKRIEALSRLVGFLEAYRTAWVRRRSGLPDVIFPPGTYLLRIAHGVRCEAPA